MKKLKIVKMTKIAEWSQDSERMDRYSIAGAFVLNEIFDKWVRLSAESQRLVFGFVPFGKVEICACNEGILTSKSVCFGTDISSCSFSWDEVEKLVANKRKPAL